MSGFIRQDKIEKNNKIEKIIKNWKNIQTQRIKAQISSNKASSYNFQNINRAHESWNALALMPSCYDYIFVTTPTPFLLGCY